MYTAPKMSPSASLDAISDALSAPDEAPRPKRFDCDGCGDIFEGPPHGSGLFVWTRGEETRYEEPPLCEQCASRISARFMAVVEEEDEEG